MARQFSDPLKISRALELYIQGSKLSVIRDRVSGSDGTPSLRTLSGWLNKFRRIDSEKTVADKPIEWRHIGFNGLPLDSSSYLARLSSLGDLPSLRRARWWWRIHITGPDLSDSEVISISDDCVFLDHMELLGINLSSSYPVTWENIWGKVDKSRKDDSIGEICLEESYAVCKFTHEQTLPSWIGGDGIVSITRSGSGVTVICPDSGIPSDAPVSRGWTAYRLAKDKQNIPSGKKMVISTWDSSYLFCPPARSS